MTRIIVSLAGLLSLSCFSFAAEPAAKKEFADIDAPVAAKAEAAAKKSASPAQRAIMRNTRPGENLVNVSVPHPPAGSASRISTEDLHEETLRILKSLDLGDQVNLKEPVKPEAEAEEPLTVNEPKEVKVQPRKEVKPVVKESTTVQPAQALTPVKKTGNPSKEPEIEFYEPPRLAVPKSSSPRKDPVKPSLFRRLFGNPVK